MQRKPGEERFTDRIVSEPVGSSEDVERRRGRDAARLHRPRDQSKPEAWLRGYDQGQERLAKLPSVDFED